MRRTRRALLAFAVGQVAGLARADGPTTAATQPAPVDVPTLVRQLDADDWRTRDAAGDQLVRVGEAARAAVADAAVHSNSPEVKVRAQSVIARLDRADVNRPTVVTLRADAGNPRAVFDAIAKQGGTRFNYWPPDMHAGWAPQGGPQPLAIVSRPFWEAVDQACAATGCKVDPMRYAAEDDRPTVSSSGGRPLLRGPYVVSGPITVVARDSDDPADGFARVGRQPGFGGDQSGVTIGLLVLLDPKVTAASDAEPVVTVTEAVDDQGQSVVPPPRPPAAGQAAALADARRLRRQGSPFLFANALMHDVSVDLAEPAAEARRVAKLRATVTVRTDERTDQVTFDRAELADHEQRSIGPYRLTLKHCDVDDDGIAYTVTIRAADGGPVPPSLPTLRLEDADGHRLDRGGMGLVSDGKRVTLSAQFNPQGLVRRPLRLVCTAVTRTGALTVPFELYDLPLPGR